jgi:glycosyltransferase involved in cell wall biosynthesis
MAQSNNPLVSVLVASYNNAHYILESLDSVQAQTYDNIELIIVDDCSKDNSVEVINDWIARTGYPCTFIRNERNRGVCYVSNLFLQQAQGTYFSWLASDDILLPGKLATQVECFRTLPDDYAMLFSDVHLIDENGKYYPKTYLQDKYTKGEFDSGHLFEYIIEMNPIAAVGALTRTDCARAVGGYDETLSYEDLDMWLKLSSKYKVKYLNVVVAKYRIHSQSALKTLSNFFFESQLRMLDSYYGINEKVNGSIAKRIIEDSEVLYRNKSEHARRWLRRRYEIKKDAASAALLLASTLSLPYSTVMRVQESLKKVFGFLR